MTDQPYRSHSDGQIDKIEHDLSILAGNVTSLATSVALGGQASTFIQDTVRRLESGQVDMRDELKAFTEQVLAIANDPLATAAGRAVSTRLAGIESLAKAHDAAIDDLKAWRLGFVSEIAGTIRLLKVLAAITSVAASVLSVLAFVGQLGHPL